jgi:hypothetical protein
MDANNKDENLEETIPLAKTLDEYQDDVNYDKERVLCICPKCGQKHVMNFHWIGRGIPRKFCPLCKGNIR